MATVTAFRISSKIARIVSACERLGQLKLVKRGRRRRHLLTNFLSRYPSNFSCDTIPCISGRGNKVIQPVDARGLRQLVHPHARQRTTMPSRSFVAHRFCVPLMTLGLTRNLMRFLPSLDIAGCCLPWIDAPLVADDPAVHLAHLLEVVD